MIMDDQPSLLDAVEPEKQARLTDPSTSHEAARKLKPGSMRRNLLQTFSRYPGMTAEEAANVAGYGAVHGAWKRVSDLLRDGLLSDTGHTRTASTGREQRVLVITQKGWDQL